MRRLLFLAVCFFMTTVLFAESVSKEQARQIASQFLQGKSVSKRAPAQTEFQLQVALDAVDAEGQPYIYAVNMGQQNGFVLVSGDDRFREVLGYSDTGSFDNADMPENMKAWLQGYVDEMKRLDAIGYKPSTSTSRRASGIKTAISPLIQTQWNQGNPYNLKCKDYFVYGDAVTGCVATAMAQVMYYNAVKGGTNSTTLSTEIPAYTTGYGYSVPAVPADTEIKWSDMGDLTIDAGEDAVSTLMLCCGVSVEMNYANSESGGSGASSSKIPNALITYFNYDTTTRIIYREDYSLASWTEIMYAEMVAGRPVLYGGQSSGGGHEFVVDGYDGDELFHVNWGWGGISDGYFALSVLNPDNNSGIGASTSNDGYSFGQDAVIGIQIGSGETAEPDPIVMSVSSFSVSGTSVLLSAYNRTGSTYTFDVGLGTVDEEGSLSVITTFFENQSLDNNWGGANMSYAFVKDVEKANQSVKVVPISKLTSVENWSTMLNPALYYVEVVYDAEGNPTLTFHPEALQLVASSINFMGTKYKDEAQPVEVTIQNSGDEFYGVLYFFASTDNENKGSSVNHGGITIQKGKTGSLTFEWTPESKGHYYVWVTTDKSGNNVIGTAEVDIVLNSHAPTGPFIFSELEVENTDETSWTTDADGNIHVDVYSKTIKVSPTVKNISNTTYEDITPYFYLYKYNGTDWVSIGYFNATTSRTYSAGDEAPFSSMSFGEVGYGQYKVVLKINNDDSNTDTRYILNLTKGYNTTDKNGNLVRVKTVSDDVTVDADAVAVDLTEFDYSSITPNANPNTLYIISSTQDAPASLSGKNVVKNGQIASLTLSDGYAYCSPVDFHADKITYTRTFDKYYNAGKNWTTVVLPFAATSVKNNADELLPWDVENRKFWLMEFSGENGSTVNFTTASSPLKANTPYIIALPGAAYGIQSLVGKNTLTFSADNVDVKANAKSVSTGTNYKFVGTMTNTGSLDNIYALNNDGDTFKKGTATVEPFRAYFAPTSIAATATSLAIGFGEGSATGIETLKLSNTDVKREGFYNLNGQRVSQPKKGLYIVNGKKVIVK